MGLGSEFGVRVKVGVRGCPGHQLHRLKEVLRRDHVVRIEAAHPVAACASDARVARMRDAPVGREEHLVAEVLELGRSEAPPLDELLHLPSPRCRQRDGENVLRLLAAPGVG